jgi:hypothetical protein
MPPSPARRRITQWLGYTLLLLIGLACAHAGYDSSKGHPNDWMEFEIGARTLVHWHHLAIYNIPALHLYAVNSALQIGPPSFLLIAPFQFLSPHVVNVGFVAFMVVLGLCSVRFAELTGHALQPDGAGVRLTTFFAGMPVMAAWGYECGQFHHLDDALTLTATAAAVWLCATRRMPITVGALLGLAVAAKPWGVVFVPVLLTLPRNQRPRAILSLLTVAVGFWLPFVLGDSQTLGALGGYHVFPMPGSDLALLGIHGSVTAWLRPLQFSLGVIVGSWVVWRGRWTAAPLAGIAMRVALDPFTWAYYGLGPILTALIWDITRPGRRRLPVWTMWTLVVEFGLRLVLSPTTAGIGRVVWVGSAVGLLVWIYRDGRNPAVSAPDAASLDTILARTPLMKPGDSSVDSDLASSTASSIATASGMSGQ